MDLNFRPLRADEVEVRIGMVKVADEAKKQKAGVSLLLYKDARCDMNLLDETVGPMNWMKSYSRDNRNCTVSIWDEAKGVWVSKEDTGTESNTEAEKGLASDSFKRACFNWGIGRELYTAPFIWVAGAKKNDQFWVKEMEVKDRKITRLVIYICGDHGKRIDKEECQVYPYKRRKTTEENAEEKEPEKKPAEVHGAEEPGTYDTSQKINETHWKALQAEIIKHGISAKELLRYFGYKLPSEITYDAETNIIAGLPDIAAYIISHREEREEKEEVKDAS